MGATLILVGCRTAYPALRTLYVLHVGYINQLVEKNLACFLLITINSCVKIKNVEARQWQTCGDTGTQSQWV